jgi:putative transposase
VPPTSLADLSEARREQALRRFTLLQQHLEDGVPLPAVAAHAGVPVRTAQRWLARYRSEGLAGLARRPRHPQHARTAAAARRLTGYTVVA